MYCGYQVVCLSPAYSCIDYLQTSYPDGWIIDLTSTIIVGYQMYDSPDINKQKLNDLNAYIDTTNLRSNGRISVSRTLVMLQKTETGYSII